MKTKLHISFGWLCLFTILLGGTCLVSISEMRRAMATSATQSTPVTATSDALTTAESTAHPHPTAIDVLSNRIQIGIISLLSIIVLLDIVMAWRLTQIISRPILDACQSLRALSKHDLTQLATVSSTDEVGQMSAALNETILHLRGVLTGLRDSAEQLQQASEELSDETTRTTDNCNRQSELAKGVLASTQSLMEAGSRIVQNSTEAAGASRESAVAADQGGAVMASAAATMEQIAASSLAIHELMERLDSRSHEITKVVTVIREISENTNLLALNAAIEAARAGEQGRGFAVVAGEVRRLAEHTRSATEEIASMVESIQQETANTTNAVEASRTSIGTGKQRTEEAQQMLTQIINRANHTEQLTEGTVTAAGAQSSASKQIGDHAAQVAQLAAASLDASEQAAHTGENIHTLAKQLTHIVQQFRI